MLLHKILSTKEGEVSYEIKSVKRSKSLRIRVKSDGSVVLTKPVWISAHRAENFLLEQKAWLVATLLANKKEQSNHLMRLGTPEEYKRLKTQATVFITKRVAEINAVFYGFLYGKMVVRNQKTRWGSCSRKGNLSFNYRIVLLPPECADYLIVHELCHLKEFNHSVQFWELVAFACPKYRTLRKELRKM
jgi:predicted metal-dependent hydrolase